MNKNVEEENNANWLATSTTVSSDQNKSVVLVNIRFPRLNSV